MPSASIATFIPITASTDYKSKTIRDAFEGRYVKYKNRKDKNSSMTEYLEKLGNANVM